MSYASYWRDKADQLQAALNAERTRALAAEAALAAERERAAKVADDFDGEASQCSDGAEVARCIAAAIRAQGE